MNLFWRTFVLLAVLLTGGVFAWVQTLRWLELEPRAVQAAQHTADLVNLSRAALRTGDGGLRAALVRNLETPDGARVRPRDAADAFQPLQGDRFTRRFADELRRRLGADTLLATDVNGRAGLWVAFNVDRDRYWLQTATLTASMLSPATWMLWTSVVLLATLLGSAVVARLINRPLRDLSFAASRIRDGNLDSRLDETTITNEIREVNKGFNRMARELARVEEDRAVMLAGISHDLRTPLARLRLETEMSVQDEEAKQNMALDIDQLDAIIDKFMDYARPGLTTTRPVHVAPVLEREIATFRGSPLVRIDGRVPPDLEVLADEVELGRVLQNLFENAHRYGRGEYTGVAEVSVSYVHTGPWVILSVRDQGPGVAPEKLAQLTTPFFRGNAARTAATGAGLGLAIVDKAMQRMGGSLELANAPDGGLVAHLRFKRSSP